MDTIASITFVPNLSHPYIELMIYPDFAEEIVYDPIRNQLKREQRRPDPRHQKNGKCK